MKRFVDNLEVAVTGRFFRVAKLRHEWCDFLEDPVGTMEKIRQDGPWADLFTFVQEPYGEPRDWPYQHEPAGISILTVGKHEDWWTELDFKVRNKIRKARKNGVELRLVQLDDAFARGVELIYNESPVRQGRKFFHFGKDAAEIKQELGSFPDRTVLIGAYYQGALIGFMKLFRGANILRTVHIIAMLRHRDKAVMDAFIDKAVELCEQEKVVHLQYGSWTDGGVGSFRSKHGFVRVDVPRYFVPLTVRGKIMLKLALHRPMRDRLPKNVVGAMIGLRTKWNSLRYKSDAGPAPRPAG